MLKAMDRLKFYLERSNISYVENIFSSEEGIADLGNQPFVSYNGW